MNILMNRFLIFSVIATCCIMILTIGSVSSEPYKALNGVESVSSTKLQEGSVKKSSDRGRRLC